MAFSSILPNILGKIGIFLGLQNCLNEAESACNLFIDISYTLYLKGDSKEYSSFLAMKKNTQQLHNQLGHKKNKMSL